jgi:two-component system phosphate regulon sensor histidine kinase PhoR
MSHRGHDPHEQQQLHEQHQRLREQLEAKKLEIEDHRRSIRELKARMRSQIRHEREKLDRRHYEHKRNRAERIRRHRRRSREQWERQRENQWDHLRQPQQPRWYHVLFGVSAFFAVFTLCWTGAHYATRFLDRYWPYGHEHPTLRDYISIVLALFFFGILMTIVRLIVNPDRRTVNTFTMMIDAMQRMSKGDFNINLQAHPRYAGQFYVLVENLNRMAAELGQMEQMRQEFISNVSHEIQSPLTAIKGFAQALRQNDMPPEARDHYLQIIETESERMSRLSDNLLKLTSLESRSHPFQIRKFRLDRQIRQAVLSCEPLWEAKRLELDVQLAETTLEGDEELLTQVWSNLLHNSIKFTPEEGAITVKLEQVDGFAEAIFADSGIGIAESDLPHVFERFFKVDKSRNRSAGGSGLGLSIVKKIVDLHGGSITVDSRPGQGTAFKVRLPLQAVDTLAAPRPEAAKNPS